MTEKVTIEKKVFDVLQKKNLDLMVDIKVLLPLLKKRLGSYG